MSAKIMNRLKISREIQKSVLIACGRRCCLCFGFDGDLSRKKGQIAHLDHDPKNNELKNLAYLCLEHHVEFDSKSNVTKNILIEEVEHYRDQLERQIKKEPPPTLMQMTIDTELEDFSSAEERAFLDALNSILKAADDVVITRKKRGSTKLTVQVSGEIAKQIKALLANGKLTKLGVTKAEYEQTEVLVLHKVARAMEDFYGIDEMQYIYEAILLPLKTIRDSSTVNHMDLEFGNSFYGDYVVIRDHIGNKGNHEIQLVAFFNSTELREELIVIGAFKRWTRIISSSQIDHLSNEFAKYRSGTISAMSSSSLLGPLDDSDAGE